MCHMQPIRAMRWKRPKPCSRQRTVHTNNNLFLKKILVQENCWAFINREETSYNKKNTKKTTHTVEATSLQHNHHGTTTIISCPQSYLTSDKEKSTLHAATNRRRGWILGRSYHDASKEETTSIDAAKSQSRDQVFST